MLAVMLLSCSTECPEGAALRDDGLCVLIGETLPKDVDTLGALPPLTDAESGWSAQEAADTIALTLSQGMPDPLEIRTLWMALFEGRDSVCPGADYNFDHAVKGCISEQGWHYAGPASLYDDKTGFTLHADSYVIPPGRPMITIAGFAGDIFTDGVYRAGVQGTFQWPEESGWAAAGSSASLLYEGEGSTLTITGGLSVMGYGQLYFDGLQITGECIQGDLQVRHPDSGWYTLTYDCTACGTSPDLGEVCADLSELLREAGEMQW